MRRLICDHCHKKENILCHWFPNNQWLWKHFGFSLRGGQAGYYDFCSDLCEDLANENW